MIVVIDGTRSLNLDLTDRLTIGRADDPVDDVVGLDPFDQALSRRALELFHCSEGWIATNASSIRSVYVDRTMPGPLVTLPPGRRFLIDDQTTSIELHGKITRHRVDLLLERGVGRSRSRSRRRTSKVSSEEAPRDETLTDVIALTKAERSALAALYRGYLMRFPRRDCKPLTYEEAGSLLNVSGVTVRRRIERVRDRLRKNGIFVEGTGARFELADYLLERGLITAADLDAAEASGRNP